MTTEYFIYIIRRIDKADRAAYIGCTSGFRARKAVHKHRAKLASEGDLKLYDAIRAGGGWQFYEMVELNRFDAASPLEARQRERAFFDLYKPTLNSQRPHISLEEHRESQRAISKAHYQKYKGVRRTTTTITITLDS